MATISIIGTSGVGKSFLVRQLASKECCPAFFEGEIGTIPKYVFESVFNKEPPQGRCEWYVNHYVETFRTATNISKKLGINCFVDGAPITAYANVYLDDKKYLDELLKIVKKVDEFKIDKIILITINKDKLKEFILKRGRSEEPIEETVERSLKLQDELIRLSKQQDNVIIIDRSNLDFSKAEDLKIVLDKLKL
jgi:deoxyadenosine/deoxycytidine kinase